MQGKNFFGGEEKFFCTNFLHQNFTPKFLNFENNFCRKGIKWCKKTEKIGGKILWKKLM